MHFAYLIAAHDNGDQVMALLDRLLVGDTADYAVLHLDRKSPLWRAERARFAGHASGRVHVIDDPASVAWGHRSQIDATRKMLSVANRKGFDLAHHVSGSDWPIASRAAMVGELAGKPLAAHIEIVGAVQQERMQSWWFDRRTLASSAHFPRLGPNVARAQLLASRHFTRIAPRWGKTRSEPFGAPSLKGWSWWSLPHDIACPLEAALTTLLGSGRLRFTQCSDEHVIPTFVARNFPDRLAPYRRHIEWAESSYHPKTFTTADAPAIRASSAWFARKFDMRVDPFFLTAFD